MYRVEMVGGVQGGHGGTIASESTLMAPGNEAIVAGRDEVLELMAASRSKLETLRAQRESGEISPEVYATEKAALKASQRAQFLAASKMKKASTKLSDDQL